MAPVQFQYKGLSNLSISDVNKQYKAEKPINDVTPENLRHYKTATYKEEYENTPSRLKRRIEEILRNAEELSSTLRREIASVEEQERRLKEAIVNGRSGVTTLTVSFLGRSPRNYVIRSGIWTVCDGLIQYPTHTIAYNSFTELFSTPRCIGQETSSKRDPCVFNSIIKYEIVPTTRRSYYVEEDYFCLKPTFNNTLEKYMTVPRRVVNETCGNGTIRSLADNIMNCGLRILSEYTYYPHRDETISLPLEYCNEQDGSCKLIVGWHISNKTIENFEFLKNEKHFKNFFIQSEDYIKPFM